MSNQAFNWVPLPNWQGRYKDATTGVLGFRPAECKLISTSQDPSVIQPYHCKRTGCEELASVRHKGQFYCEHHKPKSK